MKGSELLDEKKKSKERNSIEKRKYISEIMIKINETNTQREREPAVIS